MSHSFEAKGSLAFPHFLAQ